MDTSKLTRADLLRIAPTAVRRHRTYLDQTEIEVPADTILSDF
jgi:hypothetical protein